jgi:hypothetical protein
MERRDSNKLARNAFFKLIFTFGFATFRYSKILYDMLFTMQIQCLVLYFLSLFNKLVGKL